MNDLPLRLSESGHSKAVFNKLKPAHLGEFLLCTTEAPL